MKIQTLNRTIGIAVLALFYFKSISYADNGPTEGDSFWPKTVTVDEQQITLFQPQVEKLEGNQLSFIMAAGIQQNNQPTYGTVSAQCKTDINQQENSVMCEQVTINKIDFPTEKDQQQVTNLMTNAITSQPLTMSLDQLQASLKITKINQERAKHKELKHTPPQIYVATSPSVLVLIDQEPQLRQVPDSSLMRVINSAFVILLDPATGIYYLQAGNHFMQAPKITGPWTLSASLPDAVHKLMENNATDNQEEEKASNEIPNIIVSTKPASLIQLKGKPEFTPIEGTNLMYVSNSTSFIFFEIGKQDYYSLISGRWYKTNDLTGTNAHWDYVNANQLPASFSKIPANTPISDALASIPNTPEAKEAVIRNRIPQTAKVNRHTASVEVQYDGKPQFKAIAGTELSYAINTDKTVLALGDKYYVVDNGVWFVGQTPTGPWQVATKVPDEVYDIPPSSPVYPATYTYIYDSTPDYVDVGYTPGYQGSYIEDDVVVYGTGYSYQPWLGTYYYGYPLTYGFNFYYNWPYGYWNAHVPYYSPRWYGWGLRLGPSYYGPWGWHTGWFGVNHGGVFINHANYNHFHYMNANIHVYNGHNVYNRWDNKVVVNKWNQHRLQNVNRQFNAANKNFIQNQKLKNEWNKQPLKQENKLHAPAKSAENQLHNIHNKEMAQHHHAQHEFYADHHGQVYRHQQNHWQSYDAKERQWKSTHPKHVPNEVHREHEGRQRAAVMHERRQAWGGNHPYYHGGGASRAGRFHGGERR